MKWFARIDIGLAMSLFSSLALLSGCIASDKSVVSDANQFQGSLAPAEISDQEIDNYLQQIGQRIIAAAQVEDGQKIGPSTHFVKDRGNQWMFSNAIQFHLVNSKTLNAFTTGGDHVYIYNQLLQLCRNENELAAVMSHEYAHIYCRHVGKGKSRQTALTLVPALIGGAGGYLAGGKDNASQYAALGTSAGAVAGQFANMTFTRGDEAQADEYGFKFYTRAGWDPNHFGDFFQAMIDKGMDKTPGFLSDHPTLASRVKQAKKYVGDLPPGAAQWRRPPILDDAAFARMKARANQVAGNTPDDTTLQLSQKMLQALPRSCMIPDDPLPSDAKDAAAQIQAQLRKNAPKK